MEHALLQPEGSATPQKWFCYKGNPMFWLLILNQTMKRGKPAQSLCAASQSLVYLWRQIGPTESRSPRTNHDKPKSEPWFVVVTRGMAHTFGEE